MDNKKTVKRLRMAYGAVNDSDLALKLGTSPGTVSGWGDRGVPAHRIKQAIKDTGKSYEFFHNEKGGDAQMVDNEKYIKLLEQYAACQVRLAKVEAELEILKATGKAPDDKGRSLKTG